MVADKTERTIPIEVNVGLMRNPEKGDERPGLDVAMNLGHFGGVLLRTSNSSYDYATSILSAKFSADEKSTSSKDQSIELQMQIKDGVVSDASITTGRIGTSTVQITRSSDQKESLVNIGPSEQIYTLSTATCSGNACRESAALGSVGMSLVADGERYSEKSDLPSLPALRISMSLRDSFEYPQTTDQVFYDALDGEMEVKLTSASSIFFRGIFGEGASFTELDGTFVLGGKVIGQAKITEGLKTGFSDEDNTLVFAGKYIREGNAPPLRAIGYIKRVESLRSNPPGIFFPQFGARVMRLLVCSGTNTLQQPSLDLTQLDILARQAVFRTSDSALILDSNFSNDWQELNGTLVRRSSSGSGASSIASRLELKRTNDPLFDGCASP